MAAPDYVPPPTDDKPRVYASPPRRPDSWMADRPAEVEGLQPEGPGLGVQGPDQGYALKLARHLEGSLVLTTGESPEDALAAAAALATRRSAVFGRAPVVHDLTVGLSVFGFLSDAPAELVAARKRALSGVANPHHYMELRGVVDAIPDDLLRRPHGEVVDLVRDDPGQLVALVQAAVASGHAGALAD